MDKDVARQIIERYAAVLADNQSTVAGIPESKLPCDASLVKEAIRHYIKEVPEGSDAYHKLRAWYPKLAEFIPDEQARRCAMAEQAMMSMDVASEGFSYLDEHASTLQKIQNDTYLLTQELYQLLEDPKS